MEQVFWELPRQSAVYIFAQYPAQHALQGRAQITMAVHQVRLATSSQDGHECRADLDVRPKCTLMIGEMGWRAGEKPRHGPFERSGEESPASSSSSSLLSLFLLM